MEAKPEDAALTPDVIAKAMTDGGDGDDPGRRPTAEQIAKWLRKSAEIGNIDIQIEPEQEPTATTPNVPEGAGFEGMPMPNAWTDAPNQDAHALDHGFHHDPGALGAAPDEPPGLTPPVMEPPATPPPVAGLSAGLGKLVPDFRPPGMPPMMPPFQVDQTVDGFIARDDGYGGGDADGDGDGDGADNHLDGDGDGDGDGGDGDGDGDGVGDGDGESSPENDWQQEEPAATHTPTRSTGAQRFKCDYSLGLQTTQL